MSLLRNLPISYSSRYALTFNGIKSTLFFYVLFKYILKAYRLLLARGPAQVMADGGRWVSLNIMLLALRFPSARRKLDHELERAKRDIAKKLIAQGPNVSRHTTLPENGNTIEWIDNEMQLMDAESPQTGSWKDGKVSGTVYHGGDDTEEVIMRAMRRYCVSNPLHPDVFPAVRKMEAEVVAMCLKMYNHPRGCGVTTAGGTESIIMSCKAHRDWGRAVKGITEPEIVLPDTGHAAFNKAGQYLGIRIVQVPVHPTSREVDLKMVKRAINQNTVMIVGSAVNFPDGSMDDIPALGALAKKYNVGLHVDCCLGSFIVPFLEQAGFPTRLFDFRVPGVTAISCDTHKYGFAPKGSSVLMYRDQALRKHQFFVYPDWSGGIYASPGFAGSRPGSLIAGTWAVMQFMGQRGYIDSCRSIVSAAKQIETAIRDEIPDVYILGNPVASVVAFASSSVNILEVGDAMSTRGWHLNPLSNPPAVHIACTRLTLPVVDRLIHDLKECVEFVKASPGSKGNMVALYGLGSSSAIGPTIVGKVATEFLNALYVA